MSPDTRTREPQMSLLRREFEAARGRWRVLGLYERFEHAMVVVLTAVIAIIVVAAVWSLILEVMISLVLKGQLDVTEHAAFQRVFGMIFTVIIALEFKRSLLVAVERRQSIVQARTVVLLAMLAILRKLIIMDLETTEALKIIGLAVTLLALGTVYWALREQDRRFERD
ncbi:MAG: phosphate-starvation-inducible PsiE family protein [Geminicoccaceae bacterium]|nr:phosphate-starvation-inducible PsiE family protein [Geminicoccaceae bacterium]MCS7267761.1 phosphate-starvation-inducible PsiE family protein [Geminicoccaceae bacterium]MCX7628932.1 phosphate-starvation-inducible PsiE family protein [Geminicoccaceae bacterium]MDW8124315.1 phosphate-starvation-inducible PsiE family protein [Geminicoccaceae bacterium]MDW8340358.1 phosphate-starvation-inducible PsiE family protein [Geminicoccaceae bacterium]